ncbi:MAG TPA: hypothetical protein VJ864_16430 [Candidatus Binatia bacterium]|nr:hypothetical protein [Candidatus Binatia bacterium]
MPRPVRLDSPGTLHHVIVKGIEKREIIADEAIEEILSEAFAGKDQRFLRCAMNWE